MLTIRMSRVGKTKRPSYRILVQEKGRDPWGTHLAIVGHVDTLSKPKKVDLDVEAIKHWLSKGAQPSATIHNILVDQKVIEGPKVKAHPTHKVVVEKK
jgi:small subunit ribosomal protein S16